MRDELGTGHAVMMVRTVQGEYILDNRTDRVLPWASTSTRYTFIKREGSEGERWVWLGLRSSPTATATR